MILLNTTFIVPDSMLSDFTRWATGNYLTELQTSRIFSNILMLKVMHRIEEDATSIAIQAQAADLETAMQWYDREAAALHQQIARQFNSKVLFFTTHMEILAEL